MKKIAENITDILIHNQVIVIDDREIYAYGFWQGFVFLFNTVSVIFIGFAFQMLWQCVVFTAVYGVLRIYAGGYHARTQKTCYLFSMLLITVALLLVKADIWTNALIALTLVVSSIIIFAFAPVEDKNKPLDQLEQRIYKKRAYILLCLSLLLTVFAYALSFLDIAICLTVSIASVALMVILGKCTVLINKSSNTYQSLL